MKGNITKFNKIGVLFFIAPYFAFSQENKQDSLNEKKIEEVIVVGYKTQKKNATTESFSRIGSEDLKSVTTPSVTNMIQGRAAGTQVIQNSGAPGAQGSIIIRGVTSISGSRNPIWVIDGVIYNGTPFIDPNQIESINVLKDAASTALYGARGASGVIQVTTKAGRKGLGKINVSANTSYSIFNEGNFKLMNGSEMYDFYTNELGQKIDPTLKQKDFSWLKNGTEVGVVHNYTLDFSGGTDKSKTFASGNYYREAGTVKGSLLERFSFRLNQEYKVKDRLTIKPKVSITYNEAESRQHSLYDMYLNMPWDNPYLANGKPGDPKRGDFGKWWGRDERNYLYDLQWNYSKSNNFNVLINGDFEYNIARGLTFISTNNYSLYYDDEMSYQDPLSIGGRANKGSLFKSNTKRISRYFNQLLRFDRNFGNHNLQALAAYEFQDTGYTSFNASVYNIVGGKEVLDAGASSGLKPTGNGNQIAFQGVLFNTNYSFKDKYLAQFSIRRDGSSVFGADKRYGTFYSVSAGWNIHNEDFIKADWLTQLKLRGSYGTVGNSPAGTYGWQDLYSIDYIYNGSPGAVWAQHPNPNYSWETVKTTDLGLDIRLFNRLGITADFYIKDNNDMSFIYWHPLLAGGLWEYQNVGNVRNRGLDLSFNYDIIKNSNFKWSVDFNIGANRNKILSLKDGKAIPNGNFRLMEGEDIHTFYMRKWAGVDPANGDALWEVVDNDGNITTTNSYNQATLQKVGRGTPDYFGGFNTRMEYKGISLDINASFSKGGLIYNTPRELFDSDGAYPTYNQMSLAAQGWTRWQKPGDIATHPKAVFNNNSNTNKPSSRYLEDGSFLKIRSIKLGYNIPRNFLEDLKISNANIFINAENMFTFTKFSYVDPEVGTGYAASSSQYPIPRRITLGLNLTF